MIVPALKTAIKAKYNYHLNIICLKQQQKDEKSHREGTSAGNCNSYRPVTVSDGEKNIEQALMGSGKGFLVCNDFL